MWTQNKISTCSLATYVVNFFLVVLRFLNCSNQGVTRQGEVFQSSLQSKQLPGIAIPGIFVSSTVVCLLREK